MTQPSIARDLVALTKPGVTRMCLVTTAVGMLVAPDSIPWSVALWTVLGTMGAVGSANAFNMWWERDSDRLMRRTRNRPLPAGRLDPTLALRFAWVLGIASVVLLACTVNVLTASLAAFAIVSYVAVYTPLKSVTPAALIIGAIPGAIPPLLGWTAATNSIDGPAWVLFAVLLIWQIPHFIAIALFRKDEYAKAGIRVVPLVHGDAIAKIQALGWSLALLPISLLFVPMGVAGYYYMLVAIALGVFYVAWSFSGLDNTAGAKWARGYFFASLVYLPGLTIALVLDGVM